MPSKLQTPKSQGKVPYSLASIVSASLLSLGIAICLVSFGYSLQIASETQLRSFHIPFSLAVLACILSVPFTYIINGKKKHASDWQFFQPLQGGQRFVILQAISWSLFGLAIVNCCFWFYLFTQQLILSIEVIATASSAGLAAIISQILMITSIWAFEPSIEKNEKVRPITHFIESLKNIRSFLAVAAFVNLNIIFAILFTVPFAVYSFTSATLIVTTGLLFYFPTFLHDPATYGHRRWDAFRYGPLLQYFIHWHQGKVIFDSKLDANQQYMYAFAPHGVMPISATWLLHHSAWLTQKLNDTVILGSSVIQYVPLLRDAAMWIGMRQITLKSFQYALTEGKSVLIVPGGVAEVNLSSSTHKDVKVLTTHKGFLRMALKNQVPIVPVFSFGETRYLDPLRIPYITPFMYKWFRMPFPYFVGCAGFLQIPRPTSITIIVGKPITPPSLESFEKLEQSEIESIINKLHSEFYSSLKELHDKYKETVGCPNQELILVGKKDH